MSRTFATLVTPLLAALVLAAVGCVPGDLPPRHQGGPGYQCYFDEDCTTPLICGESPSAVFPVCTGTALPGEACDADTACAWLRDPDGVPLRCGGDGLCAFDVDAVEAGGELTP